jgi:hypothetical protein
MLSEREADEMATHGEVLRWSPELHYVTTGAFCSCFSFFTGVQIDRTLFPPDDEAKSLEAEERKCEDIKEDNTAAQAKSEEAEERKTNDFKEDNTVAQAKSSDDEEDNIPIAASLATAPKRTSADFEDYKEWLSKKTKRPVPLKKKAKRQTWA